MCCKTIFFTCAGKGSVFRRFSFVCEIRAVFQWDCQLKRYNDLFAARINNDVGTQGRGSFNGKLQRFTSKVKAEVPVRCLQQDMLCREREAGDKVGVKHGCLNGQRVEILWMFFLASFVWLPLVLHQLSKRQASLLNDCKDTVVVPGVSTLLERTRARIQQVPQCAWSATEDAWIGSTSWQPQRRRFVGVGAVSVTAWRANRSLASLQL